MVGATLSSKIARGCLSTESNAPECTPHSVAPVVPVRSWSHPSHCTNCQWPDGTELAVGRSHTHASKASELRNLAHVLVTRSSRWSRQSQVPVAPSSRDPSTTITEPAPRTETVTPTWPAEAGPAVMT